MTTNHTCSNCGWRKGVLCTCPEKAENKHPVKKGENCNEWKNRKYCGECIFLAYPPELTPKQVIENETTYSCMYHSNYKTGTHPACENAIWRK